MTTIPLDARIYVSGHTGLVGSAIMRRLEQEGFTNILTATRDQLDLRDQAAVNYWFKANRPEFVFLVAGTVGGIMANSTRPAEFIYDNMMIHGTIVHAAHLYGVKKLLYLGSSCIYPREAVQPMKEEALLTGPLEPTNESYAIAKIAGIKLCQAYRRQYGSNFISAMPTNLYGPHDNPSPSSGQASISQARTSCRRSSGSFMMRKLKEERKLLFGEPANPNANSSMWMISQMRACS